MDNMKWLRGLAEKYRMQDFVLDGLDDAAAQQNRQWMDVLHRAGRVIDETYPNSVYGLFVKGSRIKGYHSRESDIDVIIVSPTHLDGDHGKIWEVLKSFCKSEKVDVNMDGMAGIWDDTIEIEDLIYQVDQHPRVFNSLFGYQAYGNHNLLLARLAALEVAQAYNGRYEWNVVRKNYNQDYLGAPDNDIPKIAKRMGIDPREVGKILTQGVYSERFKRFTLPAVDVLRERLWSEYRALDERELQQYEMFDVFKRVHAELRGDESVEEE